MAGAAEWWRLSGAGAGAAPGFLKQGATAAVLRKTADAEAASCCCSYCSLLLLLLSSSKAGGARWRGVERDDLVLLD